MLDIKLIREKPDFVKEKLKKRYFDDRIVDKVLEMDKKWRNLITKTNNLRKKRNEISLEIRNLKSQGKDISKKIEETKKIVLQIEKNNEKIKKYEEKIRKLMLEIPNLPHESVPKGMEGEEVEVKRWGKIPEFDFEPKPHWEIGENLDIIDTQRGAKTSGARFYYLKGMGARLEIALINFMLSTHIKNGYTPIIPPILVKEETMYGTGFFPADERQIYKCEKDSLCIVGTSEVPLVNLHANEILLAEELPKQYVGFSTCLRREAGTHGRDTRGIYRVHQFNKVEIVKVCLPENSWKEHENILKDAEAIVQALELPYRVVNIPSGDLGASAAKKYDIEVWMPGRGGFGEIASISNCTDYQARRANIKFRRKPHLGTEYVHTLNGTAGGSMVRTMIAILENYQREDGTVNVPKVLQKYMGVKRIE